jgi:hypothetical protein
VNDPHPQVRAYTRASAILRRKIAGCTAVRSASRCARITGSPPGSCGKTASVDACF